MSPRMNAMAVGKASRWVVIGRDLHPSHQQAACRSSKRLGRRERADGGRRCRSFASPRRMKAAVGRVRVVEDTSNSYRRRWPKDPQNVLETVRAVSEAAARIDFPQISPAWPSAQIFVVKGRWRMGVPPFQHPCGRGRIGPQLRGRLPSIASSCPRKSATSRHRSVLGRVAELGVAPGIPRSRNGAHPILSAGARLARTVRKGR